MGTACSATFSKNGTKKSVPDQPCPGCVPIYDEKACQPVVSMEESATLLTSLNQAQVTKSDNGALSTYGSLTCSKVPFALRGLTLQQLCLAGKAFLDSGFLQKSCDHYNRNHCGQIASGQCFHTETDLYAMNMFVIILITDPHHYQSIPEELRCIVKMEVQPQGLCSYAERANPQGMSVDVFVSHFWGHLFQRTLRALKSFARDAPTCKVHSTDVSFWICLFALNQHFADQEVGASPEDSPFNDVLAQATCGVVMILDEDAKPFARIWCLYEIHRTCELGKHLVLIDEDGDLKASGPEKLQRVVASLKQVDVCNAQASKEDDRTHILYLIAQPWLRQRLRTVQEFRDRLRRNPGFLSDHHIFWDDFNTRTGQLLANPLLQAATEGFDSEMALSCIGLGASCCGHALGTFGNQDSDFLRATVMTRFSREPVHLCIVMAYFGNVEGMSLLWKFGIGLQSYDKCNHMLPVHWAARNRHINMLQFLYDAGVDLGEGDVFGCTSAHWAAELGHVDVLRMLRDAGVDLEASKVDGWRPVHAAARSGHVGALQVLLDAGVDVHVRFNDGKTVAHWAAGTGHVAVLQMLHAAGVDLQDVTNDGMTPAHYAAQAGHVHVLAMLKEAGFDLDASFDEDAGDVSPSDSLS
eukprot:TRINITY_DN29215_c0_g1_i1.p1 TRINITY_DN29215_c0_g1~~TRINITY_DN29215_c0_g1_i1.p1  ORF type:complete len:639 (+),score=106.46 TRINITY_DN29215_c0_g1_i1:119-2035(+)